MCVVYPTLETVPSMLSENQINWAWSCPVASVVLLTALGLEAQSNVIFPRSQAALG